MRSVLDAESPQLVVLNGDLITGENTYRENSSSYVHQIVKPLLERNLLWASTYGNHDSAYNLSRKSILAQERKYPNSLTNQMVLEESAGVSNYYLLVYPRDGSRIPSLILWFFDSRGGNSYQETPLPRKPTALPNWVDVSVVDWFTSTNQRLVEHYGRIIPALAFVHIPTNASLAFQATGVDAHHQPGINDDNPLAQQAQGWCSDGSNDEVRPLSGLRICPSYAKSRSRAYTEDKTFRSCMQSLLPRLCWRYSPAMIMAIAGAIDGTASCRV
jgi:hypothetical protein